MVRGAASTTGSRRDTSFACVIAPATIITARQHGDTSTASAQPRQHDEAGVAPGPSHVLVVRYVVR